MDVCQLFINLFNVYTVVFVLLPILIYMYFTWNFNDLKSMGIPHPKPWPVLGNIYLTYKLGFRRMDGILIKKYGKVYGFYEGRKPTLVVGDTDIIKQILVKEFPNFVNRRKMILRPKLMRLGVFDLQDHHWKMVRSYLTPAFTSGKMRQMSPLITLAADHLMENLQQHVEKVKDVDVKELCGNYTMEVIASTAFGILLDTQKSTDHPFIVQAKKAFNLSMRSLFVIVLLLFPFAVPLMEWMNVTMLDKKCFDFFYKVVLDTLKQRRSQETSRTDFLKLMVDAERQFNSSNSNGAETPDADTELSKKRGLTNLEISAQSVMFLLAGYDTTASTFSFLVYNLATNPDSQDRVLQEIQQVIPEGEEPSYDSVGKLQYLDQCLDETLRLYPPISRIDRRATKTMEIKGLTLPKDMPVNIPILALHMDPDVWPEPEKFDPDRFTPENKASRDSFHFMPFGHGPRACIGMRLAEMELKVAMAKVIQKFKFVPCENTEIPLEMNKDTIFAQPARPMKVRVELRSE